MFMTIFNVTTSGNEILITDGSINLKNIDMPLFDGTLNTTQWINDIFFRLYQRTGSGVGSYSFSSVNWATLNNHDIGMMLATIFPNLYNNPNITAIQTEYPEFTPLFARLNGQPIGSGSAYNFANTFDQTAFGTPANLSNSTTCILTHFGIGNVLDDYIPTGGASAGKYGIHLTSYDPTDTLTRDESFYTGALADVGVQYIIYSNLLFDAFSNYGNVPGGIQPFQMLAMWPPISRLLKTVEPTKNPVLYLNALIDTMWLQRGTSTYFNRTSRLNTTYGATGNYLLSVFNYNPSAPSGESWDIPVFPLFSSLFEHEIVTIDLRNKLPLGVTSAVDNNIAIQYNGGIAQNLSAQYEYTGNLALNNKKVFRRLIMLYIAAIEYDVDNASTLGQDFIDATEAKITELHGITPSTFYQQAASLLNDGEYAYFFKFASQVAFTPTGGSLTNVFAYFVNPYITWGANVLALPVAFNFKRNYVAAQTALFSNCAILNTQITNALTTLGINNMTNGQMNAVQAYVYPPA